MVFPHIARQVRAPAALADLALARVGLDLAARAPDGAWRVAHPGGALLLDGPGWRPEPPRAGLAWPVRRICGVLTVRRRRIPVELEVSPWSDAWSEISLRAIGRRPHGDARAYVRAAGCALDLLVREASEWIAEPLFLGGAAVHS